MSLHLRRINTFFIKHNFFFVLNTTTKSIVVAVVDVDSNQRPLPDVELSRIDRNQVRLKDVLASEDLVEHLAAESSITRWQRQRIKEKESSLDRNDLLLDVFRRRSKAHFDRLIYWLNVTGQSHVARLLTEDGGKCFIGEYQIMLLATV